jgi:hypothetical protein
VTVDDWTPDEILVLLRLRPELEPLGVVYLLVNVIGWQVFVPDWLVLHVRERLAAEMPKAASPSAKKPRHRHPDPISRATIKRLMLELAQRKARPRDRDFTQEKIGGRFGLDRSRIQQAEGLMRVGWDLLRSHPEFSANDDLVRWPSVKEAARILASERAEN